MSADYPNRNAWLERRYTPKRYRWARVLWDSGHRGTYVRAKHGPLPGSR